MIKKLKEILKPNRYRHSKNVAITAQCMAMLYDEDLEKSYIAGLLHDNAHNIPEEIQVSECEKYGIALSPCEIKVGSSVIHGKLGAYYATTKFDITDSYIIDAIRWHTTGRPDMTLLEKIIFTADYIEPGRNKAPNLKEIRKMAFTDLNKAVYMICNDTLLYLKSCNQVIDEATMKTLEYYKKWK